MSAAVMWFRRDLRLADNPALLEALGAGDGRVLGLFVLDPALFDKAGERRREHLLGSLHSLSAAMGGSLVVRRGDPAEVVPAVAKEAEASSVHVAADYGPYGRRRDEAVAAALPCPLVPTGSSYAVAPGRVVKSQGTPFQVFSPYYRAWLAHGWREPVEAPASVEWISSPSEPLPQGAEGVGEAAARDHWQGYLEQLGRYDDERDRPDLDSTSRMSAPLKYGEVHPRTLLADLARLQGDADPDHAATDSAVPGIAAYRRELAWREFCADLLARYPEAAWRPLRPEFERMQYDEPGDDFEAWCAGRTGYPIVDAGMRQLVESGFMHNRVRMVVASFLIKDLHVHWKHGARFFQRHLVDGDLASNSLNWQWVAGCGADPAPYFRIFNPITQGTKFDPHGDYVRRWVPELRDLAGRAVHEPWKQGGGNGYPKPIVDHAEARREALRRYEAIR